MILPRRRTRLGNLVGTRNVAPRSVRRWLSPRVTEALGYIPPAAFAALVANDLISPGAFDAGLWQGLIPWIAAAGVVAVAIKTKSMLWCCVSGIVFYIVLSFI